MLNKTEQSLTVDGDNNAVAGRDINISQYNSPQENPRLSDSAVVRVLSGLYDILRTENVQYSPVDTLPYTISDKIDHNGIIKYKKNYDHYRAGHLQVSEKLRTMGEQEPIIINKLDNYVKNLYVRAKEQNCSAPDDVVNYIVEKIEKALQGAHLTPEEQTAVPLIVFHVFARCKIFDKPPSSMT